MAGGDGEHGEKEIDPLHVYSFSTALLVAVMIAWSTLGHKLAGRWAAFIWPASPGLRQAQQGLPAPWTANCRSKLLGEGSAACLMGLAAGLVLLVFEKLFHPEVLQAILQFDPENFFM